MSKTRDTPYVPTELPKEVLKAFDFEYIVKRDDMNSDEKIGYLKAVQEVVNLLKTWSEE